MPKLTKAKARKRLLEAAGKMSMVLAFDQGFLSTQRLNKLQKIKNELVTIAKSIVTVSRSR